MELFCASVFVFLPPSTGADDLASTFFLIFRRILEGFVGTCSGYDTIQRSKVYRGGLPRHYLHSSSFMSLPSVSFFLGFENVCDPRRHRGTYRQEGRRSFERNEEVVFGGLAEETIIKDFQLYRSICLRSYGSSKKQRPEGTSLCLEPAPSWQHESFLFRRY